MFDMQRVSKTISALRKERNMTQMELADKLNISFQAVSNWERGQTMPDIAKLSELAEIFDVTIDELLGNGKSAQVVEKLIHEQPVEEELSTEDFLDVAPLVKPRQAEKLWENVTADISMKDLVMAAPFLSEGILDSLAVKAAKRDKSFEHFAGLLPYMSQKAINECLEYALAAGPDMKKVIMAVPFLDKENRNRLTDRILQDGDIQDLVALAPYIKKKKLTAAAAYFIEKDGFSSIIPLLPFLDKQLLDDCIANKYKDPE